MPALTSDGAGAEDRPVADVAFTKDLCERHRVWAVDATGPEDVPQGWRELARRLFDQIASVMASRRVGMLVVRGLGEEHGALVVDVRSLGLTDEAGRAFRSVRRLIRLARRTSERTCSVCGGPGRIRFVEGRCATRCDAHVGELGKAIDAATVRCSETVDELWAARGREGGARVPADAHASVAPGHRLYELADLKAALRRPVGRAASDLPGSFAGDPDEPATDIDTEQQAYLRALLAYGEEGSLRVLARPGPTSLTALDELGARAPHMAEVTALVRLHLKAAIAMDLPTSLPAIMLLGEPGTGKTWYLGRLAALLGVPYRRYPMSGQSLADGLVGASPTWRNARPGLVAQSLLAERVANPLLLVDEVDKARSHAMEDPYRGFYDLLEPEGARSFVDEYLGFSLDASRVLWVLAGNDLSPLPAPIVDRLAVVTVPTPEEAHLRAVAASIYDECNAARCLFFAAFLEDSVVARLVETNPRGIRKAIIEAMTRAAASGRRILSADDVVVPKPPRRSIGFR